METYQSQPQLPLPEAKVPTRVATVIFVRYEEGIPYILMAPSLKYPGTFTLPGGRVYEGTNLRQGLIEEIQQETGLININPDLLVQAHLHPFIVTNEDGIFNVFCFFAYYDEIAGERKPFRTEPDKQGEWVWVTIPEMMQLAVSGRLPYKLLDDTWLEAVEEIRQQL